MIPEDERSPQLAYYHANREKSKAKTLARHHAKKEEQNAKARAYAKANPEIMRASKERTRAKTFGLTIEQLREMLARPVCDICGEAFSTPKHRHIDHCHATGKVRGVLCSKCNLALSHMRDKPELLRKAAAYLEENG